MQKASYRGLHIYNELLHTFYLLRICDYKEASLHVDILDAALKDGLQTESLGSLLDESTHKNAGMMNMNKLLKGNFTTTLELGSAPLGGEWLPRAAVSVLVDLMAVMCARPKGIFKECDKRLTAGLTCAQGSFHILFDFSPLILYEDFCGKLKYLMTCTF